MLGAAWVGWGAGLLPPLRGRAEVVMLAAYGAASGLVYGLLLNLSFWPFTTGMSGDLSFVAGAPVLENLHRFLVFTLATQPRLGHRAGDHQRRCWCWSPARRCSGRCAGPPAGPRSRSR